MNAPGKPSPADSGPAGNYLTQAWLVLLLAVLFGGTLAGVEAALAPTIEANKINETREKVPELVWGLQAQDDRKGRVVAGPLTVAGKTGSHKKTFKVYKATDRGSVAGWVVKSSGQGYAGTVELLLGLNADASRITGLFILDQKETPGLGNRITETGWRQQFANVATNRPLSVVKRSSGSPGEIDAIAGATISSASVCAIINQTVKQVRKPLAEKAR
jgi:electron transport complex protein RnfG